MVAVLGPPPLEFLKRSGEHSLRYWDENGLSVESFFLEEFQEFPVEMLTYYFRPGNWRGLVPIPSMNLEQLEQRLQGEDKDGYLQFLRKMLCWIPEERPTAEELIFDPWLMEGLFDKDP
jgi:serine/threonine-protein kinase SRPK3